MLIYWQMNIEVNSENTSHLDCCQD